MIPPKLPLSEVIANLQQAKHAYKLIYQVRSEPQREPCDCVLCRTVDAALHYLALPLGRCETCRHLTQDEDAWCELGVSRHGRTPGLVTTLEPFGCTLHEPAPPAAGEETRDGK